MIIKKFGRIYEDEHGQLQIKDFDIVVGRASDVTEEEVVRAVASYLLQKAKIYDGNSFSFSTERIVTQAIQKAQRAKGCAKDGEWRTTS